MKESVRHQAVETLLDAYRSGEPVHPLTETFEGMTLDDAYAVQLAQVDAWQAMGHEVRGHKVGLTSVAMQSLLGVAEPDYGHLMDNFFHLENSPISVSNFIQPRIEPEVGLVLKRDLRGPGVTPHEAIAAVDFALPALEIVDSRIRDWKIRLIDTIADNASSGAVVLGATPVPLDELDLRLGGALLEKNGEIVGSGAGGAVLGSPINSLVWLANAVGSRGVTLRAGQLILPGAVCAMVPVEPHDIVSATFAGLGSVTARFIP